MNARMQTAASSMNITREDIDLLVREPSPAARSRIAGKIAAGYNTGLFTEGETRLANEIFRLLLKDTEVKIRKMMSEALQSNLAVPHDIIWTLANDVLEVALPVLEHSYVLTEEDLIVITRASREHPRLMAIARRASISKELTHALICKRDEAVTKTVLRNASASIADASVAQVMDDHARDNTVLEELVLRGGLPYHFAEKLFATVSDSLKKQLTRKYKMNKSVIEDAAHSARERAMLQFISPWMSQQEINQLVDQMHRNKRLTDSVIIRSLCIGDLRFFEACIAKRVGIPVSNARILILDPGPLGFKALYESAGMSPNFYQAVHTMLHLALEETQYGNYRSTDFAARMIERIAEGGFDRTVENMGTLLTMIGLAVNERATLH